MKAINRKILEQVIEQAAEPMLIIRVDHPDWPVALSNAAFGAIGGNDVRNKAFADVIENLLGRDVAVELSEAVRTNEETNLPLEHGGREYMLALRPLALAGDSKPRFYAAYWRTGVGAVAGTEMHHELLKAKRRIRDLSREDPVTGLLNQRAFYEVLDHDWAVAARERRKLAIIVFSLDDFAAYQDVFGHHATDSCMRRVGQTVRRFLRRASDVIGRLHSNELVVISHAADAANVREFAARIAAAVRELGLHHPRSTVSRFVTVSFEVGISAAADNELSARQFVQSLLDDTTE